MNIMKAVAQTASYGLGSNNIAKRSSVFELHRNKIIPPPRFNGVMFSRW